MVTLLEVSLASNPNHRMAFEYLMAYYLMDLDLKKAMACLPVLDHFSYAHLPRSYEEALLLYQVVTGVQVDLKGHSVRAETAARFSQFASALRKAEGKVEGQTAITDSFGDTYWYYYFAVQNRRRAAAKPDSKL
jgi:hypothetical protein